MTAGLITAGTLALAAPAAAQLPMGDETEAQLIEWDVTPFGDMVAGALTVDDKSSSHSKVWFVTRVGENRLYRLSPALNMKKDSASARSWALGTQQTGGLRLRHSDDGRFAFVDGNLPGGTLGALVAIDTKDDTRITWTDRPFFDQMSDVSVDTRGGYVNVFTAAPFYDPTDFPTTDGVVQRLKPGTPQLHNGKWMVPAEVTRYPLGGGAGTCVDTGPGFPCIPGIVVDRRRGSPIFVSEPNFVNKDGSVGAVAEIDPRLIRCPDNLSCWCVKVRHWPLPAGTENPRQILLDDTGRLWGITSSGNLFSLEIDRNCDKAKVTKHDPIGFGEDLFALAPAGGIIGFTDTSNNKVSVLFPQRVTTPVSPVVTFIKPVTKTIWGDREGADPRPHTIAPRVATAMGVKYTNVGDGTYIETDISTATPAQSGSQLPSMLPTGMVPDGNWKTGGFFYGVTATVPDAAGNSLNSNRIGHFAINVRPDREVECRKGDNDFDHDGKDNEHDDDIDDDGRPNMYDDDSDNDTIPDALDKDKDNDGIEDEYHAPGNRESKRTDRGQMAPGESRQYEMEYDAHSVLMLAIVEAADLTTPLSIQIVNDDGVVLVSTPPVVGKAVASATPALPGVYTIRVTNAGLSPVTYKTTLVGRQLPF